MRELRRGAGVGAAAAGRALVLLVTRPLLRTVVLLLADAAAVRADLLLAEDLVVLVAAGRSFLCLQALCCLIATIL